MIINRTGPFPHPEVVMRTCLLSFALVGGPLWSAAGQGVVTSPVETIPQIVVSARGEVRVTPDRATLSFTVETRRPFAAQAAQENARLQRAVLDTLKALGVGVDQLSTTDYSVTPEQKYDQQRQRSDVVGYIVRNTIRVRVLKLEQLGSMIDAALAKGSNVVSSLDLYAANVDQARRQALADAVEKARKDAEVIAQAAGGTLGGVVEIVSQDFDGAPPIPMRAMAVMRAESGVETPVVAGNQLLQARVSTRWRFVPSSR